MTQQTDGTTPAEAPEPEQSTGDRPAWGDALAAKVDSLADAVRAFVTGTPSGGQPGQAEQGEDVAAQVRAEVGKIKEADERRRGRESRLDQIEQAVRKIAEKPPREYRRVTKFWWGEDREDR